MTNVKIRKFTNLFESKSKKRFKSCIYKLHKDNQMLRKENDSMRAFKHDFNNMVQVMSSCIQNNNMEMLKKYFKKLYEECEENKVNDSFRKILKENPAIYKLIENKYEIAKSKGIKMNIEILCDLKEINENIYEITRIMGILMDNAIEAANECEQSKEVYFQILKDFTNNEKLIIIENTYKNKNVDLKEIYKKNFSTKEKNSGLGLWEVKKILSKTNSLSLNTFKGNDYFKQRLAIKG